MSQTEKQLHECVDAIFFDFDGVLVESTEAKTQAFRDLFAGYPPHVRDAAVGYHLANVGRSRFEKFEYLRQHVLGPGAPTVVALAEQFSRLVFDQVLHAEPVEGSLEFLSRHAKRVSLFVVSSTPHEELKELVARRGLDGFLRGSYGSPGTKTEWIREILRDNALEVRRSVMVGDTVADWEAASANGVRFIARVDGRSSEIFPAGTETIADLNELEFTLRGTDPVRNKT